MTSTFAMVPATTKPVWHVLLIGLVVVPAVVLGRHLYQARLFFSDAPIPRFSIAVLITVFIAAGVILGITLYSSRHARFDVSPAGLRIRGDLYGRFIPYELLRVDAMRVVDVSHTAAYHPRLRTIGTAIPGYAAGWFRLRNGEKALLYLTDRSHVLYIPTTRGYSVLLSVHNPEDMANAIRRFSQER